MKPHVEGGRILGGFTSPARLDHEFPFAILPVTSSRLRHVLLALQNCRR